MRMNFSCVGILFSDTQKAIYRWAGYSHRAGNRQLTTYQFKKNVLEIWYLSIS